MIYTVEINVWAVFSLLVWIQQELVLGMPWRQTSGSKMLMLGIPQLHRDEWTCWWGQWSGFPLRRVAVEGSIRYSTKTTNANSLWAILRSMFSLRVRYILESDPILGLSRGLQYPYYRGANQADVYYCIHLQVDIGINMGMYNGVTSRHSILIHTN